jgi:ArsR family transcriptional regulator, arsenate/arsenite/antimonite-responsive transcriptional repressor
VLRDAGLVNAERDAHDARWIYYSVNQRVLTGLRERLDAFLDVKRIQPRHPKCGPRAGLPKPSPHSVDLQQ